MRKFDIAQIHVHRNVSRDSDVQPILKNLVMPSSKLRWIHRCPVSRRNFTKICFNSGPISLSNSRCQRNLGIKEWTWIMAHSVPRQCDECNMKPVTPSKKWSKTTKCAPMESSFPHSSAHVSLGPRRTDHWQDLSTHQKHLTVFAAELCVSVWCYQVELSSYSTKSPKSCLSQGAIVFIDRDNYSA